MEGTHRELRVGDWVGQLYGPLSIRGYAMSGSEIGDVIFSSGTLGLDAFLDTGWITEWVEVINSSENLFSPCPGVVVLEGQVGFINAAEVKVGTALHSVGVVVSNIGRTVSDISRTSFRGVAFIGGSTTRSSGGKYHVLGTGVGRSSTILRLVARGTVLGHYRTTHESVGLLDIPRRTACSSSGTHFGFITLSSGRTTSVVGGKEGVGWTSSGGSGTLLFGVAKITSSTARDSFSFESIDRTISVLSATSFGSIAIAILGTTYSSLWEVSIIRTILGCSTANFRSVASIS